MIDIHTIVFILFIVIIAALVLIDRKNVTAQGLLLMRKTKKGRRFINQVAKSHPLFWKRFANVAIVVGFIVMVLFTILLIDNGYRIATGQFEGGGGIVVPYPTDEPTIGVGYVLLPIWLWIAAIIIIIIPHEFAHGIISRMEKIRIKSLGWLLFIIIPGAFVEPDEKQLKKSKKRSRLRVYAVGSFANLCTAAVLLAIMLGLSFVIISNLTSTGVTYGGIINGTEAYAQNLSGVITSINNQNITNMEEFLAIMENKTVNDTVKVGTAQGNYTIPLTEYNGKPIIGISNARTAYITEGVGGYLVSIHFYLSWIMLITMFVGMVNLLPIKPLDGGLMLETVLEKYTKHSKKITTIISVIVVLILIFNIIGGQLF